ncbi:MAG: hypothetical protein ACRC7W_05905, partial [Fusobacteriaceae bacterium]
KFLCVTSRARVLMRCAGLESLAEELRKHKRGAMTVKDERGPGRPAVGTGDRGVRTPAVLKRQKSTPALLIRAASISHNISSFSLGYFLSNETIFTFL